MKRLFAIFILLSAICAQAQIITLTITVTNLPSNDDFFTINSDSRTNKTSVTVPAKEVEIGASIGAHTTNLFNQAASYLYTGPLIPIWIATNEYQLRGRSGQTISATASGTWATLTLTTQAVTTLRAVRVPISSEPTASAATNIASLLIDNLFNEGLSTNTVSQTSPAMAGFVNVGQVQTITGDKTWTGTQQFDETATFGNGWVLDSVNGSAIGGVTNSSLLTFRVTGDAVARRTDRANGDMLYSNGTDAADLTVGRRGVGLFWISDDLQVAGSVVGDTTFDDDILAASNIGLGTSSFGTSAAGVLSIGNGTPPASRPANLVQLGAEDQNGAGGHSALHVRGEAGGTFSVGQFTQLRVVDSTPIHVFLREQSSGDTVSPNALGSIDFQGWVSGAQRSGAIIFAEADENWSGSAGGTRLTFHATPKGQTTSAAHLFIQDGAVFLRNTGITPSTTIVDTARFRIADANGAGTAAVHIRDETGMETVLGANGLGKTYTVYAAGTAASLPTTSALLDFGTTDPAVTISLAGTYALHANVSIEYNGATFAANQTVTLKLRKTSGTAADVSNSTRTFKLAVVTTETSGIGVITLPPVTFTAAAADVVEIWGSVGALPSAGSVDAVAAEIYAVRIQ